MFVNPMIMFSSKYKFLKVFGADVVEELLANGSKMI